MQGAIRPCAFFARGLSCKMGNSCPLLHVDPIPHTHPHPLGNTHVGIHAYIDNTNVNGHVDVDIMQNAHVHTDNTHVNEHAGMDDMHNIGIDNTNVGIGNTHAFDNAGIGNTHVNTNGNKHVKDHVRTHVGKDNTHVNAYASRADPYMHLDDAHVRMDNANVQAQKSHVNSNDAHHLIVNVAHRSVDNLAILTPPSTTIPWDTLMNLGFQVLHLLCSCGEPIPLASLPDLYHNTFRIPISHQWPNHAFVQALHQLKDLIAIYSQDDKMFVSLNQYGYEYMTKRVMTNKEGGSAHDNLVSSRGNLQGASSEVLGETHLPRYSHTHSASPELRSTQDYNASSHSSQNNETSSTQVSPCKSYSSNSHSKLENGIPENLVSTKISEKHVSNRRFDMEGAASLDAVNSKFQIYITFAGHSTFTEDDASRYFSAYGRVKEVRIPSQAKRDYGFVRFADSNAVKRVLEKENPHFILKDRIIVKPFKRQSKSKCLSKSIAVASSGSRYRMKNSIQQNADIAESPQLVLQKSAQYSSSRGTTSPQTMYKDNLVYKTSAGNSDTNNTSTRDKPPMRSNEGTRKPLNVHAPPFVPLADQPKCDLCLRAAQVHKYPSCRHGYCSICRAKLNIFPLERCPICVFWNIER